MDVHKSESLGILKSELSGKFIVEFQVADWWRLGLLTLHRGLFRQGSLKVNTHA